MRQLQIDFRPSGDQVRQVRESAEASVFEAYDALMRTQGDEGSAVNLIRKPSQSMASAYNIGTHDHLQDNDIRELAWRVDRIEKYLGLNDPMPTHEQEDA